MAKLKVVAERGSHAIFMSRDFHAPRALVFKAYTDPALIPQWWGPKNTTTIVDRMEIRAGGIWRYVQRDVDGNEFGFRGVYHEVVSPERIVSTFEFEGMPGHIALETLTFEERDGRTMLKNTSVYQSVEDRDAVVQSGMEDGANDSWDRFEELLRRM